MSGDGDVFGFHAGSTPLLVSIPHDGRRIPQAIRERMTPVAIAMPDTDWHVTRLYEFVTELGASVITANYSRYVVDLNRAPSDESLYPGALSTGLCPGNSFAGEALYKDEAGVNAEEKAARVRDYWQPYHDRLAQTLRALHEQHGYALLWDAHSIPSRVPSLFDGLLPELNLGTWDHRSCAPHIAAAVREVAASSDYPYADNGRFKGGYITRHYGAPGRGVHAFQLELAQRAYMDEETLAYDAVRAGKLSRTLRAMLEAFLDAAAR